MTLLLYFTIVLIVLLIVLNHHTAETSPLKGQNVRKAKPNQYDFAVSIAIKKDKGWIKKEKGHNCGGTLITRKLVLTSAHCLRGVDLSSLEVSVGKTDLRGIRKGKNYGLKAAITYDEWAKNMCINTKNSKPNFIDDDIAILELLKCVNEDINLAVLVNDNTIANLEKYEAVAIGWGIGSDGEVSRFLQMASLKIINLAECNRKLHDAIEDVSINIELDQRYICTIADPYILLGGGDSGGPLIIESNIIIGISDSIYPSPELNILIHPGKKVNLHKSIAYYRNFIENIMKLTSLTTCN